MTPQEIETELHTLAEAHAGIAQRQDQFQAALEVLIMMAHRLEGRTDDQAARLKEHDERMAKLEESVQLLVGLAQVTDGRLDSLEADQIHTDARLDALIDSQLKTDHQVIEISGQVREMAVRIDAVVGRMDALIERLDRGNAGA